MLRVKIRKLNGNLIQLNLYGSLEERRGELYRLYNTATLGVAIDPDSTPGAVDTVYVNRETWRAGLILSRTASLPDEALALFKGVPGGIWGPIIQGMVSAAIDAEIAALESETAPLFAPTPQPTIYSMTEHEPTDGLTADETMHGREKRLRAEQPETFELRRVLAALES